MRGNGKYIVLIRRCLMENHVVTIDNRQRISITDISEIDSFDEEEIRASLNDGAMII